MEQPSGARTAEIWGHGPALGLATWSLAFRRCNRRSAPAPLAPGEPCPLLDPTPEGIAAWLPGLMGSVRSQFESGPERPGLRHPLPRARRSRRRPKWRATEGL